MRLVVPGDKVLEFKNKEFAGWFFLKKYEKYLFKDDLDNLAIEKTTPVLVDSSNNHSGLFDISIYVDNNNVIRSVTPNVKALKEI